MPILKLSAMSEWDRPGKYVDKAKRDCLLVKDQQGHYIAILSKFLILIKDKQIYYALYQPDYLYVQSIIGTWYLLHCTTADIFTGEKVIYESYEDEDDSYYEGDD